MAGSGGSARVIVCDVRALREPDAHVVDALARLQVAARRSGVDVRFEGACRRLCDLVELMGLRGVLDLEPRRQPEQGEQAGRVEEERDAGDAVP